jgi:mannose-6-phosphate isomerase-like protein (cupin superfamily)
MAIYTIVHSFVSGAFIVNVFQQSILYQQINGGMFMQTTEKIIDNTYMGEQIEFIEPDEQSLNRYIEYYHHMFWKGSGFLQEHIHPEHDEVFEVIKGKATYYVNGKKYKAREGTTIRIPKGKRHINPFNGDLNELIIKKKDSLNLQTEHFYRHLYNMADKGKFNSDGIPNRIQHLALTCSSKGQTVFTSVPLFIQKPLLGLFGWYFLKPI